MRLSGFNINYGFKTLKLGHTSTVLSSLRSDSEGRVMVLNIWERWRTKREFVQSYTYCFTERTRLQHTTYISVDEFLKLKLNFAQLQQNPTTFFIIMWCDLLQAWTHLSQWFRELWYYQTKKTMKPNSILICSYMNESEYKMQRNPKNINKTFPRALDWINGKWRFCMVIILSNNNNKASNNINRS